jgi:hypothetical protein
MQPPSPATAFLALFQATQASMQLSNDVAVRFVRFILYSLLGVQKSVWQILIKAAPFCGM